jgi:ferredoxin
VGKVSKYARKLTQCGFNPDCETKFGNDTSGGGVVWNRREGRLQEIVEEQFLADYVKGSWILHMLSRQFGEMNLQCRGSCFCGLCKGDFARIDGIPDQ